MDGEPVFREVQHFRQPWLIGLLAGVVAIEVAVLFVAGWRALPGIAIGVGATALMLATHLATEVSPAGISLRFYPFHRRGRTIAFEEIAQHYPRRYRPIAEYGGWGIRGIGRDRAYNVSGDRGVQLELVDGRRILIGSQRPDELDAAIARFTRG